jgi:hypothetical protein
MVCDSLGAFPVMGVFWVKIRFKGKGAHGAIQIAASARNVPLERKIVIEYFFYDKSSLQDEKLSSSSCKDGWLVVLS